MAHGTREDYALLSEHEGRFVADLPGRLIGALDALKTSPGG